MRLHLKEMCGGSLVVTLKSLDLYTRGQPGYFLSLLRPGDFIELYVAYKA